MCQCVSSVLETNIVSAVLERSALLREGTADNVWRSPVKLSELSSHVYRGSLARPCSGLFCLSALFFFSFSFFSFVFLLLRFVFLFFLLLLCVTVKLCTQFVIFESYRNCFLFWHAVNFILLNRLIYV